MIWSLIGDVLTTAYYIAICVLLFSVSIAIHEFGHFIVALKLGYRVERFSLGFGPAIWKKTWRGVEYRVSWIPLGGYVSIPDVDPEGTKALEGSTGKASEKKVEMPPWKDLLVALAGPAMNVVLAFALATILYFAPGAHFGISPAVVGDVVVDGPADKGGLAAGDEVVSVDGHKIESWSDMNVEVQFAAGREVDFVVLRNGVERTLKITPVVKENGVAYIDAIKFLDGDAHYAMWMQRRGILDQVVWDAGAVFRALKGLVTPKEMKATGNAVGGPVLIAQGTYKTIRRDKWDGVGFLRMINTNLAVMNLLPIPVLDGGLILFSLVAIVFRRRIPEKIAAPITTVFMYLIVGLMLFLVVSDFFKMKRLGKPVEIGQLKSEVEASGAERPAENGSMPAAEENESAK